MNQYNRRDSSLLQEALKYKAALLNENYENRKFAILELKKYFSDPEVTDFVQVVIDLDIHNFLLNQLILMEPGTIKNILNCIELLCLHKIYFSRGEVIPTTEKILHTIFYQIKNQDSHNYLKEALSLLSTILFRLNDFQITREFPFENLLLAVFETLASEQNIEIKCFAINLLNNVFRSKHLQGKFEKGLMQKFVAVLNALIEKFENFFTIEPIEVQSAYCKFCYNALRFVVQNNYSLGNEFHLVITKLSIKCAEIVTPYIVICDTQIDFMHKYINFIDTFLGTTLLNKSEALEFCKCLINSWSFNVIVACLKASDVLLNMPKIRKNMKICSLSIICEVMMNFWYSEEHWLCGRSVWKKNLMTNLYPISINHNWMSLLENPEIQFDSKIYIIMFCSLYYVHANNCQFLHFRDLHYIVNFLNNTPLDDEQLPEPFIKELWLLFSALYNLYLTEANAVSKLDEAHTVIQKLLIPNCDVMEVVYSGHFCIINWICLASNIDTSLRLNLFRLWLRKSHDNNKVLCALNCTITKCDNASKIVLYIACNDIPVYASLATEVLQDALSHEILPKDSKFVDMLCKKLSVCIHTISIHHFIHERVLNLISVLHLNAQITTTPNIEVIEESVKMFTSALNSFGMTDMLPDLFYEKAFEYIDKILAIAYKFNIKNVFRLFMISEQTLKVFLAALFSENYSYSLAASKILVKLLDYEQNIESPACVASFEFVQYNTSLLLQPEESISIHCNLITQRLHFSPKEQLLFYLQMLSRLITVNGRKTFILFPVNSTFIKGLYLRCIQLLSKPKCNFLEKPSFQCLNTLLDYTFTENSNLHEYLLNMTTNFTLVIIKIQQNSITPHFCNFIIKWLHYVILKKDTCLQEWSVHYSFWKILFYQLVGIIAKNCNPCCHLQAEIGKQLLNFTDMLPSSSIHYLEEFQKKCIVYNRRKCLMDTQDDNCNVICC